METKLLEALQIILLDLLHTFIIIVLPVVIGLAVQWIKAQVSLVKSRLSHDQIYLVESLVGIAVKASEQAGLTREIEDTAYAKKQYAIDTLRTLLISRNMGSLAENIDELSVMIEASIKDGIHKGLGGISVVTAIEGS